MEKEISVHVGLALLAIKKLCTTCVACEDCPMQDCCYEIRSVTCPAKWDSDTFPKNCCRVGVDNQR